MFRAKSLLHIVAALALIVTGFTKVSATGFADLFRAGLDAEDAGNLDDALNRFSDALKLQPKSAHAWAKRGEIYLKRGNPQSAIGDLVQATKLDPGFAAAFTRLGFAYNATNDHDRALEALDMTVKLDPT